MGAVSLEPLNPNRHRVGVIFAGGCFALLFAYGLFSTPGLLSRWGGVTPAGLAVMAGWSIFAALLALAAYCCRGPLAIAAMTAVVVVPRVVVAQIFSHHSLGGDARYYPELVNGLLQGQGLRVYEPFIGATVRGLYPPLYPLALAAWGAAAGLSVPSLTIMNTLIDAGTACAIGRLGRKLEHQSAGNVAGWLYLAWPAVVLSVPVAQKEGLCALLVVLLATAWLDVRTAITTRSIIAIGLTTGLLALAQPALASLSALIGLALYFREPARLARIAIPAVATTALVMSPWWFRNWIVFGAFVPLTTSAQISLWIGNNPQATGNWLPTPSSLRGMPELAYAKAAGAMARDWIMHHPLDFVRLTLTKFVRATSASQAEVARFAQATPSPSGPVMAALFPVSQFAHLVLLGGAAAALLARARSIGPLLLSLLLAFAVQLALFNVWFEFGERHREFLTPLLLLVGFVALGGYARCFETRAPVRDT